MIENDYYKIVNAVILDSIISSGKETIYKEFVEQNLEVNYLLHLNPSWHSGQ